MAQRSQEGRASRHIRANRRGDEHFVDVQVIEKARCGHPATAHRRVHELHEAAMPTPDDDEMRVAVGLHDDGDGGKRARFFDEAHDRAAA